MQVAAVFHVLEGVELVVDVLLIGGRSGFVQHIRHKAVIVAQGLVILVEELKERVEVGAVLQLERCILDLPAQILHLLRETGDAVRDGPFQLMDGSAVLFELLADAAELRLDLAQVDLLDDGLLRLATGAAAEVDAEQIAARIFEHGQHALPGVVILAPVPAGVYAALDERGAHFQTGADDGADDGVRLRCHGRQKPGQQAQRQQQAHDAFFHRSSSFLAWGKLEASV